jgi:hypothetical protein
MLPSVTTAVYAGVALDANLLDGVFPALGWIEENTQHG